MIQITSLHLDTADLINLCNSIIPEEFTVPRDEVQPHSFSIIICRDALTHQGQFGLAETT